VLVGLCVRRVDHDVHVAQVREGEQLRAGERGLGGAAPPEDDDLLDPAARERLERVVGDVGAAQVVDPQAEDAGDVECDVAVADDHRALARQVEGRVAEVRVAVVPGDERGGRVAARQVLARDAEVPVVGCAHGVDHGVVVREQLLVGQVTAHLHVEVKAEVRGPGRPLERPRDALGPLMVGGDPGAHEPPRGRQPVQHLDLDGVAVGEEVSRSVGARRAGADDGHAQRFHAAAPARSR
jgi:hypothetical protein